jgi:hypothetical protein
MHELSCRHGYEIGWEEAKRMLERVVYDVVTPERVNADASTMKATYKAIVDAKGGYISGELC